MTHFDSKLAGCVALLPTLFGVGTASAQFSAGNTWLRTDAQGKGIEMTVEACCGSGHRLIYRVPMPNKPAMTLTVDSPMDGSEVPTLFDGKPSGQTMAIKRIDPRHYEAILRLNGQRFGSYSGVFSPDGKALTVNAVMNTGEKMVETWVKK